MKCPYKQSSLQQVERTVHDLINEETGVAKGQDTVIETIYEYCDCIKEECAVWYDEKCHYNGY